MSIVLSERFLGQASPAFDDARCAITDTSHPHYDEYMVRLQHAVEIIDAASSRKDGSVRVELDAAAAKVLAEEAQFRSEELYDDGQHAAGRGMLNLSNALRAIHS